MLYQLALSLQREADHARDAEDNDRSDT